MVLPTLQPCHFPSACLLCCHRSKLFQYVSECERDFTVTSERFLLKWAAHKALVIPLDSEILPLSFISTIDTTLLQTLFSLLSLSLFLISSFPWLYFPIMDLLFLKELMIA